MVKLKLVKDSNKSYVIREKDYSDLMDIVLNLRMIEDILLSLLKMMMIKQQQFLHVQNHFIYYMMNYHKILII